MGYFFGTSLTVPSVHRQTRLYFVHRSVSSFFKFQVIDTRPMVNAKANMAGGKGHESDKYYENMRFTFKGIENIHKMRKSLEHLTASVVGGSSATLSMEAFMTELANSGWLKHIRAVLDTSCFIVECILNGYPTLVHCSDGWDRTSQTCALAQLMLDGYYRTMQGFQALIEKDWLAFGHKFQDRCGHITSDPNEASPIFSQFLDAVWQLMQMFPCQFQVSIETVVFCKMLMALIEIVLIIFLSSSTTNI